MQTNQHPKSGQAIIFLLVVVVIGLFLVIWNFDLHRVVTAKVQTRNAVDAAAMTGARWQGITINMIGELNLIQAAILSTEFENQLGEPEFVVPEEVTELHGLRKRLNYIGPLAAFALAQQAAFDNGAVRDPVLESDLFQLAEELKKSENQGTQPYDNAAEDYAALLEVIIEQGVAAGSYVANFPDNPLTDEAFYAGIAQALGGGWCGLEPYDYWLGNYEDYESWPSLDTDLEVYYPLELKLSSFVSVSSGAEVGHIPPSLAGDINTFLSQLQDYFDVDEFGIFNTLGSLEYATNGMYPYMPTEDITWHIFGDSWRESWPDPAGSEDDLEEDEDGNLFPIWGKIQPRYNYMGAEAGFGISAPVHRGIVAGRTEDTVTLRSKAKAKPFGYIEAPGEDAPPHYFGYVLPVFTDVRLIHSDIGDKMLAPGFYRHVVRHLEAYQDGGPDALSSECPYCRLLKAWEELDLDAGARWLEDAEGSGDNPCDPTSGETGYGGLKGGASGGA